MPVCPSFHGKGVANNNNGGDMKRSTWTVLAILNAISMAFLFIDLRITVSFILGSIVSILLFKRNETYCDDVLDDKYQNKARTFMHFTISYLMMALCLVLCALKQEWFNVIACALGLMSTKWAIIIDSVIEKRKVS